MRNSEAQKYARWSAAVAAVLLLLVVGLYLRNAWQAKQAERKAPPGVPSTVEQQSAGFSFSKVEGQRTIYTVQASRQTQFKENDRDLLEDVSVTVFGRKGERHDTLLTRACNFLSSTGKITCAGDVQIDLRAAAGAASDADARTIRVMTSNVSFDQNSGEARTDNPVTFRWSAGEGRATGARYDSNSGTLRLDRSVELTLAPSPTPANANHASPQKLEKPGEPEEPEESKERDPSQANLVHLNGDRMVFERDTRAVQLLGAAHVVQNTDALDAESLLLQLDESLHARQLVATGHPRFHDSAPEGPMSLDADEISASMTPEGWVKSILATGNAHGNRTTPAGADSIQAGRMEMDLVVRRNAPRLLTANDHVVVTSRGDLSAGGTRRVETDALQVNFADAPRSAGTRVETANTLAPAQVEWQNTVMASGAPVQQTMRMRGQKMNMKFDEQNQVQQVTGSGGVEVTRRLGAGPEQTTTSRDLTAKFTGGEWATIDQSGDVRFRDDARTGQGDRALLDRATNTATLTGGVVLTDETTRTTARSATFTQDTKQLRADGHVLTTELRAGSGTLPNLAPEAGHILAEHLVADSANGHAVYSGGGRMWQGDSVVEADTIELDKPSHTMIARGNVRGIFLQAAGSPAEGLPSGRAVRPEPPRAPGAHPQAEHSQGELWHVKGGQLTYWELESRARLEQNASAVSAERSMQADRLDIYFSSGLGSTGSKQIVRALADGNVDVRQEGRRGTSEQATYTVADGKFVLSGGKPTVYDSNGDTTTGRELTFYFADDRIVVDSQEGSRTVTLHRVEK